MRCLMIGNFGTSWDSSICDEEHIAKALEDLRHDVTRSQRSSGVIEIETNGLPLNRVKYDFALIAQWDGYPKELISYLRRFTNTIVYWAFDYQADGQEWHERLVNEADLYLSKRLADSKYPNWRWLSQDFAPEFLDRWEEPISVAKYEQPPLEKNIDVLFTGSYLPWATERNETLKAVDEKFKLVIHSVNDWPDFRDIRPSIMDQGLPALYARAKVVLSIDHTLEAGYWSDRNAQIMCCGGRPLFRYVPLSEARFGNYVDYFYSVEDCLEKIEDYLNYTNRGKSEESSYQYAQANLKVKNRVQDLLILVKSIL